MTNLEDFQKEVEKAMSWEKGKNTQQKQKWFNKECQESKHNLNKHQRMVRKYIISTETYNNSKTEHRKIVEK